MHETVFAKDAIKIAKQQAEELEKGSKIIKINVVLSKKSHVTAETLKEAFQLNAKGTPVEGIAMEVETQDDPEKEFYIKSIEVEKE